MNIFLLIFFRRRIMKNSRFQTTVSNFLHFLTCLTASSFCCTGYFVIRLSENKPIRFIYRDQRSETKCLANGWGISCDYFFRLTNLLTEMTDNTANAWKPLMIRIKYFITVQFYNVCISHVSIWGVLGAFCWSNCLWFPFPRDNRFHDRSGSLHGVLSCLSTHKLDSDIHSTVYKAVIWYQGLLLFDGLNLPSIYINFPPFEISIILSVL